MSSTPSDLASVSMSPCPLSINSPPSSVHELSINRLFAVKHLPPTRFDASNSATSTFDFLSSHAACNPARPAPTTATCTVRSMRTDGDFVQLCTTAGVAAAAAASADVCRNDRREGLCCACASARRKSCMRGVRAIPQRYWATCLYRIRYLRRMRNTVRRFFA